jgi:hypothetical protein
MEKNMLLIYVIDASTHVRMVHAIMIAIVDVFAQIVYHTLLVNARSGFIFLLKKGIVLNAIINVWIVRIIKVAHNVISLKKERAKFQIVLAKIIIMKIILPFALSAPNNARIV